MKRLLTLALVALARPVDAEPRMVTVVAGGDTMFGRVTPHGWRAHSGDMSRWASTFADADVALLNLESGVCVKGREESLLPLLWAPPAALDVLVEAGIDGVSVANNHALDCGPDGVEQTRTALNARGIAAIGIAPTGVVAISDDVVVLAATLHPPPYRAIGEAPLVVRDPADLAPRITAVRTRFPDRIVLVSLHWGRERAPGPAASQRRLARALIDAGANAVLGHGPHVQQPTELYGGGVIHYSLGNLSFDDRSRLGSPRAPATLAFRRSGGRWSLVPSQVRPSKTPNAEPSGR